MDAVVSTLALVAVPAVLAVTVCLAVGCLVVAVARSPIVQLRAGELTIVASLVVLVAALLPLERPLATWLSSMYPVTSPFGDASPAGLTPAPSPLGESTLLPAAARPRIHHESVSRVPSTISPPRASARDHTGGGERATALPENRVTAPRRPVPAAASHERTNRAGTDTAPAPDAARRLRVPILSKQPRGDVPRDPASKPAVASATRPAADEPAPAPIETRETPAWWTTIPWLDVGIWSWLAALGLALCWLLVGYWGLARLRRWAVPLRGPVQRLWDELSAAGPRAQLLSSEACRRPLTYGVVRPVVLLPLECCRPERAGALRQVLLHELCHLRQRDALGQALFNLALPLLCLHPLYWWMRRRTELCRELIADDWAAGHSTRAEYARELVGLIAGRQGPGLLTTGALGVFQSSTEFYRRMTMLLNREEALATGISKRWRVVGLCAAVAVVMICAGTLGVSPAPADDDPEIVARDDDARDEGDESAEKDEGARDEEGRPEGDDENNDNNAVEDDDDAERETSDEGAEAHEENKADDDHQHAAEEDREAAMAAEEQALAELQERRQQLADELAQLEFQIVERASSREQRLAEEQAKLAAATTEQWWNDMTAQWREAIEQSEARLREEFENRLNERLAELSESHSKEVEERQQLSSLVEELSGLVRELREEREELRAQVNNLTERLDGMPKPEEESAESDDGETEKQE